MSVYRKLRSGETIARRINRLLVPLVVCFLLGAVHAQSPQQQAPATITSSNSNSSVDLQPLLTQIDQSAQSTALDIAKLRIEKWKADSNSKQQAQANAESLQRNLSNALPTLTTGVRSAPQALAASFKLYRNLTALYDVLSALTESAGAFGPGQEFNALRQHLGAFEGYRRSLGDYLETLTATKDAQLIQASRPQQQVKSTVPKKIITDDDPPPTTKKKSKKKAAPSQ